MTNDPYEYWILLSLCIIPYLMGYAIHQRHALDSLASSRDLQQQHMCSLSIHSILYTAAVSWALLFIPVNLYAVGWIVLSVQQVLVTNVLIVLAAELITDPNSGPRTFDARTLLSPSTCFVVFATALYTLLAWVWFDEDSTTAPGGDARESQSFWIGTAATDIATHPFLSNLLLFVGVVEVVLTFVTFAIRVVVIGRRFNPRYANWVAVLFGGTCAAYNFALKAFQPPVSVALHRVGVWVAFYLVVAARSDRAPVYYPPIRSTAAVPDTENGGLVGASGSRKHHRHMLRPNAKDRNMQKDLGVV